MRRAYDVIGFDPRGVGQSAPVDCGPMGGLFDGPGADPVPVGSTAEQAYLASLRRIADDCAAREADVLPYFSTEQIARDMDAIRAALGNRGPTSSASPTAPFSAPHTPPASRSAPAG